MFETIFLGDFMANEMDELQKARIAAQILSEKKYRNCDIWVVKVTKEEILSDHIDQKARRKPLALDMGISRFRL